MNNLMDLTAQIVSAHLTANSSINSDGVISLIRGVYQALKNIDDEPAAGVTVTAPKPAVPVTRSVFPDYLVCLEDGKQLKMLKRHLMTNYNMTVDQYRKKWDLPLSYPVVAPNYANLRSDLAKSIGLGKKRK